MKNLLKFFTLSAAVLSSLISCEKADNNSTASSTRTVEIIADAPTTKTHYDGTLQIKWDKAESDMFVIQKSTQTNQTHAVISHKTRVKSGLKATFRASLNSGFDKTWGIYPSSSANDNTVGDFDLTSQLTEFKINVPSSQTPVKVLNTEGKEIVSFDPTADLLISSPAHIKKSNPTLKMRFNRPLALVELNITPKCDDSNVVEEKIQKITFSSDRSLAGSATVDLTEKMGTSSDNQSYGITSTADARTIELDVAHLDLTTVLNQAVSSQFMAFPGDLDNFTVTVFTDKNIYKKDYAGTHLQLKANTKLALNLKLDLATKVKREFAPVKDESSLKIDDKIIFVDGGFAMGNDFSAVPFDELNQNKATNDEILRFVIESKDPSIVLRKEGTQLYLNHSGDPGYKLSLGTDKTVWYKFSRNEKCWITSEHDPNNKTNIPTVYYDSQSKKFAMKQFVEEGITTVIYKNVTE